MSNFQPREVVGRGSETQLQVGENSKKIIWQDNGYYIKVYILTLFIPGRMGGLNPSLRIPGVLRSSQ